MYKRILLIAVSISVSLLSVPAHAQLCKVDQLRITKVKCLKPAGGFDSEARALVTQLITYPLGGYMGVKVVSKLKITNPVKAFLAEKLVNQAISSPIYDTPLELVMDQLYDAIYDAASGTDQLIVRVNGKQVLPESSARFAFFHKKYELFEQNDEIEIDARASFIGSVNVQLIEYDTMSVNDDLGEHNFFDETDLPNAVAPINQATVAFVALHAEDGSVYEVTYEVIPGAGNANDIPERLLCDTDTCFDAREPLPNDHRGLLKTTLSDLKNCPDAYTDAGGTWSTSKEEWFRVCEFKPNCGAPFRTLDELGGASALKDGDLVVLRGHVPPSVEVRGPNATDMDTGGYFGRYLGNSNGNGQYLARCPNCSGVDDVRTHVLDRDRDVAQWVVKTLDNGKIALRADSGKYLAVCEDCAGGSQFGSFLYVSTPSDANAQFTLAATPKSTDENRYALLASNGLYLASCQGCTPGSSTPGLEYSSSFYIGDPDSIWAGWSIGVRTPDRVDPILYAPNRTIDSDLKIKRTESWVVEAGQVLTINRGATLTIEYGAKLENNGTIINHGTIRIGDSGAIVNAGFLVNRGILRLEDGKLNNLSTGAIDNSRAVNIQNLGSIVNNGTLYEPFGRYYGTAPEQNALTKGYLLKAGPTAVETCHLIGGNTGGSWDESTSTCTAQTVWVKLTEQLHIASGTTLAIPGQLNIDGVVSNQGTIDNTVGSIRVCGALTLVGGTVTNAGAVEDPCTTSAQEQQCIDLAGAGNWNNATLTCSVRQGATVPHGSVLAIGPGVTWRNENILENNGTINIDAGGTLVNAAVLRNNDFIDAGGTSFLAHIVNHGTMRLEVDGGSGIASTVENEGIINNYGFLDNGANIIGNGSVSSPVCGVYQLSRFGFVCDAEEAYNLGTCTGGSAPWTSPFNVAGQAHFVDIPQRADQDMDGLADDCEDTDDDNDLVEDNLDVFPYDVTESADSDNDGVGDNADVFPNDSLETSDTDVDSVGDNFDVFPTDSAETSDRDGDGVGDNADLFPDDPFESVDSDDDGVGDSGDAFPNDPTETRDTDNDGTGDNSDTHPHDASNTRLVSVQEANGWSLSQALFMGIETVLTPLPEGVELPLGLVNFDLASGNDGSEAVVVIHYAEPIDTSLVWWKFGSTHDEPQPHWFVYEGAVIDGNTVTLTLTDGGAGDDDLFKNGQITDPGGLGTASASTDSNNSGCGCSSAPTHGKDKLVMLLIFGFGIAGLRRRRA